MADPVSAASAPRLPFAWVLRRFPHLPGDARGGFASALVGLPYAVTSAMLVFAPLGAAYIGPGMIAGLLTALVAGLVTAAVGGTALQINGPRASTAILMASIVALAMSHPGLRGISGVEPARALGVAMICLALAGALQIGFGVLRMGSMVRFLPYPVISGFMVGLGVLVAGPQIPALLGVFGVDGWDRIVRAPTIQVGSFVVGLATIGFFLAARRWRPKWPGPLIGMILATMLHHGLAASGFGAVGPTGWDTLRGSLPPMPWRVPQFVLDHATFWAVTDLLPAVATLAFVASLETLLSASVISIVSNMRYDSRKELIGQGLSNITVALVGGVASCGAPFRGVTNFSAGGRTRASAVIHALLVGGCGMALAPLLFQVPLAAWAGVLVIVGVDVASAWAKRLRGNPRAEIAVGFLVAFVTLALGTVPAILVGIAGSLLLYVHRTSRAPIRGHYDGRARSSLRVRPAAELAWLKAQGAQIRVVELQGALFFGTADRCGREIEQLGRGCTHFILDLRRVSEVDTTGGLVLMQTLRRVAEGGASVALASVGPRGRRGRVLELAGLDRIVPHERWFADADAALDHAETALLARRGFEREDNMERTLAAMDVAQGLAADELQALRGYLKREAWSAGATLFREGDAGESMYLVAKGCVTVRLPLLRKRDRSRRLATYGPGLTLGEMAVLEAKPRSADAVCDGDTVLYALERSALQRMAHEMPALYGKLLLNLSRQLSWRVRATNLELRAALD